MGSENIKFPSFFLDYQFDWKEYTFSFILFIVNRDLQIDERSVFYEQIDMVYLPKVTVGMVKVLESSLINKTKNVYMFMRAVEEFPLLIYSRFSYPFLPPEVRQNAGMLKRELTNLVIYVDDFVGLSSKDVPFRERAIVSTNAIFGKYINQEDILTFFQKEGCKR